MRVNVLGEKLVAFRDTAGTIGLLDAYCPHRRANLFWGRNEQHGLRCVYHGWKFDVDGRCTDLPNCPEGATLKDRVKTRAYPTLERGGLIFAYLGPPEHEPEFPNNEGFDAPPDHRFIRKMIAKGNYLQLMEGDVDSSHVSFLHSRLDDMALRRRLTPNTFQDRCRAGFDETDYGLTLRAAQRRSGPLPVARQPIPDAVRHADRGAGRSARAAPGTRPDRRRDDDALPLLPPPERPLTADEIATIDSRRVVPEMIPGRSRSSRAKPTTT